MKKFIGLAGSEGCALARAAVLRKAKIDLKQRATDDPEAEIDRFRIVQRAYVQEMDRLYQRALKETGEKGAEIFQAYHDIANDAVFFQRPIQACRETHVRMDYAIEQEKRRVLQKFQSIKDPYLKERADDIRNVCDEIIRRLNGILPPESLSLACGGPFILVADELSPEDTVRLDKSRLAGFVTERGGVTSHVVILAKSLGIPAVVGAAGIMDEAVSGQTIYLNGGDGYGLLEPDEETTEKIRIRIRHLDERKNRFARAARLPAVAKNGRRVFVCVNTGDPESLKNLRLDDCDGVGLYRTEFLFMDQKDYPDEEFQFSAYRRILEAGKGKEITIRTLDIGGDKQLGYMDLPKENNPFLGYRAIRLCLDRKEVFSTQLRALLRASASCSR